MWKMDGWKNLLTGLGIKGMDSRSETFANWDKMSWQEIESLYSSDEIASKVVDYLPEEMMREDYVFSHLDADHNFNFEMKSRLKKYNFNSKILDGLKFARLYGEAYIVMGINDGKESFDILDMNNIKSLDWCHVFHKFELIADEIGKDVTSEYYNKPETYRLLTGHDQEFEVVHASRIIKFTGAKLPHLTYRRNLFTHDTVLNKVKNSLANYNTACDSLASLVHEFSLGIFKMKGLAKLVGSGKESQIITRMGMINAKKSVVRAIVLDSDEDFKRENITFAGVSDTTKILGSKLVSDSNMPHTIVLGEGSTGTLSGGGMSERKDWYDYVSKKQEADLEPQLIKIGKITLMADGVEIPEGFDVDFESLFQMTDSEKADIRLKTSQADASDIMNQILDPDEVALSRFGSGKYSIETQIENDIREKNLSGGAFNRPVEE